MPLLDLKTDLKSLKYGNDQPGNGSSRQPYIKTDINTVDRDFNRFRLTKFDDGLIRGGAIGAINASVTDVLRIGKFFVDFPKGPLFIAKQVGLQLSNPKLEHKKDLKTNRSTSGQGLFNNVGNFIANTANRIENEVGPTRIYNLGLNTLAQVGVEAFGQHIIRHGFLPTSDPEKLYEAVVTANNNADTNRLAVLTNNFNLGPWGSNKFGLNPKEQKLSSRLLTNAATNTNPLAFAVAAGFTKIANTNYETKIDDYTGGPGSTYGIGRTIIMRSSNTEDKDKIDAAYKQSKTFAGLSRNEKGEPIDINYINTLGVSRFYFNPNELEEGSGLESNKPNQKQRFLDLSTYSPLVEKTAEITINNKGTIISTEVIQESDNVPVPVINANYGTYKRLLESRRLVEQKYSLEGNPVNEFGIYGNSYHFPGSLSGINVLPDATTSPVYSNGNKIVRIGIPWDKVTREIRVGSGLQDGINLTPIFRAKAGSHPDRVTIPGAVGTNPDGSFNINDLVKFRIQAINTDSPDLAGWMAFRAYITDLSDNTDATWNEVKYAGRGDKFYIYDGFSRKMSVSFKVAALSEEEMKPMYQKLNFLMSNLMPDYDKNLMRGPMMRMTIGNWIDGQLCILNSLSYKIPQDSPWEIALNENLNGVSTTVKSQILPHVVEVTLSFTPIGSQTRDRNKLSQKSSTTSHIAQNWNEPGYISGSEATMIWDETANNGTGSWL